MRPRLMDLVVHPSCQTPRPLLGSPRPPSSWVSPKSTSKAPELSLLQTPQVVKVSRPMWNHLFWHNQKSQSEFVYFVTYIFSWSPSLSELGPWLPPAQCSQRSPPSPSCAAAWGPHLSPPLLLLRGAPSPPHSAPKRAGSLSLKRRNLPNQRRASDGPMG